MNEDNLFNSLKTLLYNDQQMRQVTSWIHVFQIYPDMFRQVDDIFRGS
jgi:hypothetical protein